MGALFRSEHMSLVQLFVQFDAAHDTVDQLGRSGLIQFKELNPDVNPFQRNFANEVKRCDEMERRVNYFQEQAIIAKMELAPPPPNSLKEPLERSRVDQLDVKFEDMERDVIDMTNNKRSLDRRLNELVELQQVLLKDTEFFQSEGAYGNEDGPEATESTRLLDDGPKVITFGFLTGVLHRKIVGNFTKVLWRTMRGNLIMKLNDIEENIHDPSTGELSEKSVFIIFYQGQHARNRMKKICESFGVNLYQVPETKSERADLMNEITGRISDLNQVLLQTEAHNHTILQDIAQNVLEWKEIVLREKAIYHHMNMFNYDVGRKCLIAEGWCAQNKVDLIREQLQNASERTGVQVPAILNVIPGPHKDSPPTHFATNKFTIGFQRIVDAYGMARYREINPGVFTIITFPFLFGVMFGDAGHGTMMLIFALWLLKNEKEFSSTKQNEIFKMLFGGRYVILLMSLFSIYMGFIYNDAFSIEFQLFPSMWEFPNKEPKDGDLAQLTKDANEGKYAYPFGIDWQWKIADNELDQSNSLKMKSSVVLGVTQMVGGIILSAMNAVYFKKPLNFFFEFIPQMVFMLSTFGYMVFLIFYKWTNMALPADPNHVAGPARILTAMIKMFLSPFKITDDGFFYNRPLQLRVQQILIVLAVISIPVMLLVKPLILRRRHKQKMLAKHGNVEYKKLAQEDHSEHQVKAGDSHAHDEEDEEEFDFSEIFVHQIIHTIEFVLGAVSNTASYLRLWALSLAHAELSTVFWDMIMIPSFTALHGPNGAVIFCGFAGWGAFTIGVLLVMESLSAFLHALRLHWVEFQNKFYMGDGHAFIPFNYQEIIYAEED